MQDKNDDWFESVEKRDTKTAKLYAYLISTGIEGATRDEMCEYLGADPGSTMRTLESLGAMYPTFDNRKSRSGWASRVYRATRGVSVVKPKGPPRRDPSETYSEKVSVYLKPRQKSALSSEAECRGIPVGTLARDLMLGGWGAASGEENAEGD